MPDGPSRADATRVLHVVTADLSPARCETLSVLLAARSRVAHRALHLGPGPTPLAQPVARIVAWPGAPWTAAAGIRRELRRMGGAVLHAWTLRAAAACSGPAADGAPLIIQTDGDDDAGAAARWHASCAGRASISFILPAAVPQRELARHGVPVSASVLIRESVDFAALNAVDRERVRGALALEPAHRALLLLPPIERWAGHFVAAWATLLAQVVRRDLRLIVPGDGAESRRVSRLLRDTGFEAVLRRPGEAFTLPQLLVAADMVLFLPERRASVRGLAWAMAAGRPILASAVWTVTELLADGHNAWLVRADDPRGAARRIVEILERPDRSRDVTSLASAQAYEVFGRQRMITQFHRAYSNVAAGRPVGDGIIDSAQRV